MVYTFLAVVFSWEVSCSKPYSDIAEFVLPSVSTHALIFYWIRLEYFSRFNINI